MRIAAEVRTSRTDPLRVDWLIPRCSGEMGGLGLTFCPGKAAGGLEGPWQRDLSADIQRLRELGADVLVSLVTDAELTLLGVPELVSVAAKSGLIVLRHPVQDGGTPTDPASTTDMVESLAAMVRQGRTVVAHCRGGLGRAGLLGACLLLRLGPIRTAQEAIGEVRRVRGPKAVENAAQEAFVASYARLSGKHLPDRGSETVGTQEESACGDGRCGPTRLLSNDSVSMGMVLEHR
jgi:cyclin-dependent kinase inhibitor 3